MNINHRKLRPPSIHARTQSSQNISKGTSLSFNSTQHIIISQAKLTTQMTSNSPTPPTNSANKTHLKQIFNFSIAPIKELSKESKPTTRRENATFFNNNFLKSKIVEQPNTYRQQLSSLLNTHRPYKQQQNISPPIHQASKRKNLSWAPKTSNLLKDSVSIVNVNSLSQNMIKMKHQVYQDFVKRLKTQENQFLGLIQIQQQMSQKYRKKNRSIHNVLKPFSILT